MSKKLFLLLLLPLFAFAVVHKYYLSVTQINFVEKDSALQITSRFFTDDVSALLLERYEIEAALNTEEEHALAQEYLKKYIDKKFKIVVNQKEVAISYIGREYKDDQIVFYLEVTGIKKDELQSVEIQSDMLSDMFEEQKNIVHIKFNEVKKSFVLIKENNKGMLNF